MSKQAMELAILFHEIYERLAPQFGYKTKPETREFNPNSPNGRLMIAVCEEIKEAIKQHDAEPVAWMCKTRERLEVVLFEDQTFGEITPLYLSAPSIPEGMMLANIAAIDEIIDAYVPSSVEQAYREALSASPQPTKGGA